MKEGWKEVRLGDVAKVAAGNSAPQDKELFSGGSHPFVRTSDVGRVRFGFVDGVRDHLTEAGASGLKRFPPDTILFPKSGASTFLNHRAMLRRESSVASHLAAIEADTSLVHPRFLLYHLSTVRAQDLVQENGYPSLNLPQIKGIRVNLPPLPEQERIVAILDEAFEAIATATANTEKNLANARALYASRTHEILSEGTIGREEQKLGDVCELYQGLAINKKTKHLLVENSDLPLLRIKDLRFGTSEQFISESGYPRNAEVGPEHIIYTRTGSLGLVFRGRVGVLHNNCFKVVPSESVDPDYLFWWLQDPSFKNHIIALASRAAQPDITHKLFKAQSITLPSLQAQARSAAQIESLNSATAEHIAILERKGSLFGELTQSVLTSAFAGELTAVDRELSDAGV